LCCSRLPVPQLHESPSEVLQGMLIPRLGEVQGVSDFSTYLVGESKEVLFATPHPPQRL
jgi:hypothetical protein